MFLLLIWKIKKKTLEVSDSPGFGIIVLESDVECFYYLINLSISRKPGFKEWHIWCSLGLFTEHRFPCHSKYVHIRILYVTNISCFRVFVFKADWLLKHLIYFELSVISKVLKKTFQAVKRWIVCSPFPDLLQFISHGEEL